MFRTHQLIEIGLYDEEFRRLEERELRRRFEQKFQIARLEIPFTDTVNMKRISPTTWPQ